MRHLIAAALVAVVPLGAAACATEGSDPGGGCHSHYDVLATAPSWPALRDTLVADRTYGRVARVRTQTRARGDVEAGQPVRTVDLLSPRGRRVVQADVWLADDGSWRAGVWSQCTDS